MNNPYYDSDLQCVMVEFSGSPDLKEFKALANPIISLLKKHKANKELNNTLNLEVNSIENQEWAQTVWFPDAVEAGLKYFAFVVPSNIFGQVSAEQTNEKAEEEGAIEIKYFETEDKAKEWLKTCN